jgi:hypothetical protein
MTETFEKAESLEHLDFQPSCQMLRCEASPNPATHIMEAQVPHCGCRGAWLICTDCVRYFWTVKVGRMVECAKHTGDVYFWPDIVTTRPLRQP